MYPRYIVWLAIPMLGIWLVSATQPASGVLLFAIPQVNLKHKTHKNIETYTYIYVHMQSKHETLMISIDSPSIVVEKNYEERKDKILQFTLCTYVHNIL